MNLAATTPIRATAAPTLATTNARTTTRPRYLRAIDRYSRVLPKHEANALRRWALTFWAFQREWLFEDAPLAACNKARQIGFSHATAGVAVLWGAFHGELTTVISIGDRESVEVLDKCERHVRLLQKLGSQCARLKRPPSAHEIEFVGGGRIIALPASGGRSFTGNVFLDEFAYQAHAQKVWDSAAPTTSLGFKIRVSSTPNGVGNEFHRIWERAQDPTTLWVPHEVPLSRAIDAGFPVNMARLWELAHGDERIFGQMYACSFLDSEFQYIPTDVIADCAANDYAIGGLESGEHYAGLDIAREADLTALVVVRVVRGKRYVVHVETGKRTDAEKIHDMVAKAFERYKLKRLCVDRTGLGIFPAEAIKKKHSERIDVPHRRPRVELVDFTPKNKEALATGLYSAMTGETLVLPKTDATLRTAQPDLVRDTAALLRKELASIRRKVTASGNVVYESPRTKEGHGDRAWGLALAVHACSTPNAMFEALTKQ